MRRIRSNADDVRMTTGAELTLRGHAGRRLYTVVVFIVLASLDNVAIGLVPPLFSPIAQTLDVSEGLVSFATGATYLLSAIAAVGWAYFGDRTNRKPLLMLGTVIWAVGTLGTALSPSFIVYVAAQLVGAIGLGAVASVGFSVVSDLISPRRRGLVMSFWGLSQGVGTLVGVLLGGLLGSVDWRRPFFVLTGVALAATLAYVFTYNIRRGESEPQLAGVFAAGDEYEYRISRADLPRILARRTNVWLILQGFTAQLVFGSLVLLPRLFQAKAEAVDYSQTTAIQIGSVYATLFQLGAVFSIVGGLIGDRLQRRTPRGRAMVASIGILAAVPFYVVLFFVPLRLDVSDNASAGAVVTGVLGSVVTQPVMAASFLAAVLALALTSANSPNWFALITEVNPPEHRGTVFSLGNLTNGAGRAVGVGLTGPVFRALQSSLASPLNFAVGLAAFQVFFIPTGVMYWLASRTSPRDIAVVRNTLAERAATAEHAGHPTAAGAQPTS
jgi:MFS transporter, Spinster family, sphingosine-1-phosphate transporter